MKWYKIDMIRTQFDQGEESKILGHFEKVFMCANAPEDAAIFASGLSPEETDDTVRIYFSPYAYALTKTFLEQYSGEFCERPDPKGLSLLGGYPEASRLLE